jgi:serine/threonine protein kinase
MLKFSEEHLNWVRFCFCQIVKAVGELHEKGFVHRDLKPSNFLINDEGKIFLKLRLSSTE